MRNSSQPTGKTLSHHAIRNQQRIAGAIRIRSRLIAVPLFTLMLLASSLVRGQGTTPQRGTITVPMVLGEFLLTKSAETSTFQWSGFWRYYRAGRWMVFRRLQDRS